MLYTVINRLGASRPRFHHHEKPQPFANDYVQQRYAFAALGYTRQMVDNTRKNREDLVMQMIREFGIGKADLMTIDVNWAPAVCTEEGLYS
ncbi:hypothetical protein Btru_031792, partial [Bulinus truncatus]